MDRTRIWVSSLGNVEEDTGQNNNNSRKKNHLQLLILQHPKEKN